MKSSTVVTLLLVAAVGAATASCSQDPPTPSVAGLNACTLLTGKELVGLGVSATGQAKEDGGARSGCSFNGTTPTAPQLGVTLAGNGYAGGNGKFGQHKLTIGRHTAFESATSMTSQCEVDMVVGHDLVLIVSTGASEGADGQSTGPACTLAHKAAPLIEAKLP
jgi:hypothetical protein